MNKLLMLAEKLKANSEISIKAKEMWVPMAASNQSEINILGEIGDDWESSDTILEKVQRKLDIAAGSDVVVNINSFGGDLIEGVAIYNILRQYEGKVTVKILGIAASAASLIALSADDLFMSESSFLMIHNGWTFTWGNKSELRESANRLYEYYFIRDLYETNPNIKPYFYVYNTDVIANRSQYGIRVRDSNGNVVFHSDMTLLKPITGVTIGSVATDHYYDLKGSIAGKRIALNSCGGHMAAATDGHFISGFTTTYKIINSTIIRGKDFTIFRVAGSDDGVIRTFNDNFGSPDPNFRYMYLMAIDVTNIPF